VNRADTNGWGSRTTRFAACALADSSVVTPSASTASRAAPSTSSVARAAVAQRERDAQVEAALDGFRVGPAEEADLRLEDAFEQLGLAAELSQLGVCQAHAVPDPVPQLMVFAQHAQHDLLGRRQHGQRALRLAERQQRAVGQHRGRQGQRVFGAVALRVALFQFAQLGRRAFPVGRGGPQVGQIECQHRVGAYEFRFGAPGVPLPARGVVGCDDLTGDLPSPARVPGQLEAPRVLELGGRRELVADRARRSLP